MIDDVINAVIRLVQGQADPVAAMTNRAAELGRASNWRESIVDLLKLVDKDSSKEARAVLWSELGNIGDYVGSAEQNISMHKQVMRKIADRGIKVPT